MTGEDIARFAALNPGMNISRIAKEMNVTWYKAKCALKEHGVASIWAYRWKPVKQQDAEPEGFALEVVYTEPALDRIIQTFTPIEKAIAVQQVLEARAE